MCPACRSLRAARGGGDHGLCPSRRTVGRVGQPVGDPGTWAAHRANVPSLWCSHASWTALTLLQWVTRHPRSREMPLSREAPFNVSLQGSQGWGGESRGREGLLTAPAGSGTCLINHRPSARAGPRPPDGEQARASVSTGRGPHSQRHGRLRSPCRERLFCGSAEIASAGNWEQGSPKQARLMLLPTRGTLNELRRQTAQNPAYTWENV